jgi:hypothetical protein
MKAAILNEMGRPRPYANSKPLVVEDVSLDPPGAEINTPGHENRLACIHHKSLAVTIQLRRIG